MSDGHKYNSEALEPFVTHSYDQHGDEGQENVIIERNVPFLTDNDLNGLNTKGRLLTSKLYTGQQSDFELRTFNIFALVSGHNDVECPKFVKDNIKKTLQQCLPKRTPPFYDDENMEGFNKEVRVALVNVFRLLNYKFNQLHISSGASLTLIIQYGWHLMCANVGDAKAYIDTKGGYAQLTTDHKLEDNPSEIERAMEAGVQIARFNNSKNGPAENPQEGRGVLRMWSLDGQGGLAVSRSIGHYYLEGCIWHPSICHIELDRRSLSRLIIASRGCWDYWPTSFFKKKLPEGKTLIKYSQKKSLELACQGLIKKSLFYQGDQKSQKIVSVVLVDMSAEQFLRFERIKKQKSSEKTSCFAKPQVKEFTSKNVTIQQISKDGNSGTVDRGLIGKGSQLIPMMVYKYPIIKIECFDDSYRTYRQVSDISRGNLSSQNRKFLDDFPEEDIGNEEQIKPQFTSRVKEQGLQDPK